MSVQVLILKLFKEAYPNAKLKDISDKTGIQITRVFRLMNGAEMKVSELESFQSLLQDPKSNSKFIEISKSCALNLSPKRRNYIQAIMEQALKLHSFSSQPSNYSMGVCHDL